jgi:hypothetical protein
MKKLILLFVFCICNMVLLVAQTTTITIGNGTSNTNNSPINRYYNYSRWEAIYLQSEIVQAGNINKIKFTKHIPTMVQP